MPPRERAVGELNAYGYVAESPVQSRDPLGLFSIDKSCECLARPGNPGGADHNWGHTAQGIASGCARLLPAITDARLRRCMEKSCRDGKVKCDSDCGRDPNGNRYWAYSYGAAIVRRVIPGRSWYLCLDNYPFMEPWKLPRVAIHEWAHGCGWDHFGGGGVPGDDGFI